MSDIRFALASRQDHSLSLSLSLCSPRWKRVSVRCISLFLAFLLRHLTEPVSSLSLFSNDCKLRAISLSIRSWYEEASKKSRGKTLNIKKECSVVFNQTCINNLSINKYEKRKKERKKPSFTWDEVTFPSVTGVAAMSSRGKLECRSKK